MFALRGEGGTDRGAVARLTISAYVIAREHERSVRFKLTRVKLGLERLLNSCSQWIE